MKKLVLVLTIVVMLVSANIYAMGLGEEQEVKVLIIYDDSSSGYLDVYQNYKQSLVVNLKTEIISLNNLDQVDLSEYHMIYLDRSTIGKDMLENSKKRIMDYVSKGGYLFLEDPFYDEFPLDFIGAKCFKEIKAFPKSLKYPKVRENLQGIQDTLKLFHEDLVSFFNMKVLEDLDKGHGFIPSTAIPLAYSGDLALYGLNQVGEGYVFYANSMLPNHDYITGFDLRRKDKSQQYFSFTFATGNFLFRNEFPALVSKELYGYAAKKVLGPYGRPAMAWQNHFEVTSAMGNGTMERWIDLLKEYHQIPSFSLARSPYEWGHWQESIVLHTNRGEATNPKYKGVEENSHYSSGKHLYSGKAYVALEKYEDYKGLSGDIDLPYRAYPTVGDLNGDGILDIVSGSQDGYLYLFLGKEEGEGINYQEKTRLKDTNGQPIHLGSYSAPALYDINKDGLLDIIVGNGKGEVHLYINVGNMTFIRAGTIIQNQKLKNLAPALGDIDGDNIPDLVVGDAKGNLYFHKGKWVNNSLTFAKEGTLLKDSKGNTSFGKNLAPTLYDIDGDGKLELILGEASGYIKVYSIQYPKLILKGYLEGENYNLHGNKRLWGGYYSAPEFADIDGDGKVDLLVGQVEFGLPTPIDSPLFPYEKELRASIDYVKKNHIDIYPHLYLGKYSSHTQELREIELHKQAFEYYDIPWENPGTNQHTWDVNNISATQSFGSQMKQGIKWNSGFRPHRRAGEPSLSKDYIWYIPFKLADGLDTRDFILFSPAPHIPIMEKAYKNVTTLDLPISHFYHIEYAMNDEAWIKDLRYKARVLDDIRNKKDYNFMTEAQMFEIFEAVMNSNINIVEENQGYTIQSDTNIVGIKFEPGEKLLRYQLSTDGDIYKRDGKDLYLGLNKKVRVYKSTEEDKAHIVRVNCPVDIEEKDDLILIHLKGKGLQQIKIYAPKGLEIMNEGLHVEKLDSYYVLTRYGEAITLNIRLYQ